ncbi:batten's disease protein Cln3 [Yamadazyma tenuis ATCC 10573]|nr:batten's disease protein Cln3 [Yamadazyma tenuis ATCC 10573]EGV63592.1 batten's disease protein Cln3 [Yamadazyma tenuis ATCC 10573]
MLSDNRLIFISFLGFGLLNNILYVVILSAAVDLVGSQTPKAVVLLSDILPAFIIKLFAPFFIHMIPYQTRIWSLVFLSSIGMLVISFSAETSISSKIFGICMASLSSGLGELTFLQLTHYFTEVYSIGGFSMGTGLAGLGGSFIFLLLTNILGLSTSTTLLIFSIIPLGFIGLFYFVLPSSIPEHTQYEELPTSSTSMPPKQVSEPAMLIVKNHITKTIGEIKPLFRPFMIPLCTVYISEYVINQGISPNLLFPLKDLPSWLFNSYRDIYVVYGFLYQLGVFISRSSINIGIRFKKLHVLSILQFVNVVILVNQSILYFPFSSIWPLLILILYEGLLGGLAYVNTFLSVSEETPKSKREFSMGCVGMSDSLGIVIAGLINYWLEKRLCNIQVGNGRDWCLSEN